MPTKTLVYGNVLQQLAPDAAPLLRLLRRTAVSGIKHELKRSSSAAEAAERLGVTYHSLIRLVRQHWDEFADAYNSCAQISRRPQKGPTAFKG
jgi:hypothetical protein